MTKILIVDEDTDVLRLLYAKLSRAGYDVTRARDGAEALSLAASTEPDLVLMELLLPDTNGLDLLAQLRANRDAQPLILVLTSQREDDAIAAALAAGADDYIIKPFSPQGLLERIRIARIRQTLTTVMDEARDDDRDDLQHDVQHEVQDEVQHDVQDEVQYDYE